MYNGSTAAINDSLYKMRRAGENGQVDALGGFNHSPIVGGRSLLLEGNHQGPSANGSLWPLSSPPDQQDQHRQLLDRNTTGAAFQIDDEKRTSKVQTGNQASQ